MAVTLEKILTHPHAFGLTSASPLQRACCRVADGLPLGELACDEAVVRAFGGQQAIEALPTTPPKELYVVSAIRSGKSLFSAALGLRAALTIDLSRLGFHEIARVSIVSLDRSRAQVVKEHLMGALTRSDSVLKRYLVHETADRVLLKRDDGRLVEIAIAAGRRDGGSLLSFWTVAAIFDEAARMLGKADGVVNFDDMRKGVIERLGLLAGAQLVAVTSPWAARGPVYEAVENYWGRPSANIVVVRAPGPDMCPANWTPEAVERARLRPDGAYETDVLGQFVDPDSGFLTTAQVNAATRDAPTILPPEHGITYTAAMDPATSGNAWTLIVVGRWPGESDTDDRLRVVLAHQWQGRRDAPLRARDVFGEMAPMLKPYRVTEVYSDRYAGSLIAEHGDYAGLQVRPRHDTRDEDAKNYQDFRLRLLDGRLELAPVPALKADLLLTRKKLMPGGIVKYEQPVTRDGRHADFAPAAVLAVARAAGDVSWVDAMNNLRSRGGVF
jgi:hypothetical protein